jgi:hypothetical protein
MRPPKLNDNDLGRTFGSLLGKLTDDEVQAIIFRDVEIQAAHAVRNRWIQQDEAITDNLKVNAEDHSKMGHQGWDTARDEVAALARSDRQYLENERVLARAHIALCDRVIAALSSASTASSLSYAYAADGMRRGMALHHLEGSVAAVRRAHARTDTANQAWERGIAKVTSLAKARNSFVTTRESLPLSRIDALSPESFEEITAWLLNRDGCTVLRSRGGPRDQGADVIAIAPNGLRIVLQCKHSIKERNRLDPRHVHQLNGTARPVHGADIVGIVTNRTLSDAAEAFAVSQGIYIVDRRVLKRWATYGVSWWQPEEPPPSGVAEEEPGVQVAA